MDTIEYSDTDNKKILSKLINEIGYYLNLTIRGATCWVGSD